MLVQNDVRVGGYGEFKPRARRARGKSHVLAAFVGTGTGGCLIVDGKIVTAASGTAGEIGHILLKPGGPCPAAAGGGAAWRPWPGRSAIRQADRQGPSQGPIDDPRPEGRFPRTTAWKSKELAAAYLSGDAVTVSEVHRAAYYLGLGLGSLINVFEPEMVIIGGGVTEALGVGYLEAIRASAWNQVLTDPDGKIQIVSAALGDDAGILGAATAWPGRSSRRG